MKQEIRSICWQLNKAQVLPLMVSQQCNLQARFPIITRTTCQVLSTTCFSRFSYQGMIHVEYLQDLSWVSSLHPHNPIRCGLSFTPFYR